MQGAFQRIQLSVDQRDDTDEFLFHPETMSRLWECSMQDKLSWLSSVREMLDQGRQPQPAQDAVLSCLIRILVEEDNRYLIYSAKEAFVAIVTKCNVQNGARFICDLLPSSRSKPWKLCVAMEICCQLLSRHNLGCCRFLSEIRESVLCTVDWILDRETHQAPSDLSLYQMFSLFTKLAKLSVIYREKEYIEILHDILSKHESTITNILFMIKGKYYVKQKLIKFLCLLFDHNNGFTKTSMLRSSLFQFMKKLLLKFGTVAMETVVWKNGESHFMGREDAAGQCVRRFDKGRIRDWTFLCFRMAATLSGEGTEPNDVWQTVLSRMDACIKQKLVEDTDDPTSSPWLQCPSVMFPWLPVVYGDQDDAWVDVMLLLMDLAGHWKQSSSSSIQPHVYFLQFVSLTGYDHLVLVDLLTSPETSFLVFFTRYLKYFIHNLMPFITCVEEFSADQCKAVLDVDIASMNTTDEVSKFDVNPDTSVCRVMDEMKGDNGNNTFGINSDTSDCLVVDEMKVYKGNSKFGVNYGNDVNVENLEVERVMHATMSDDGDDVDDTETKKLESELVSVENTSGLALIMEQYSDSDDDDKVSEGLQSPEGTEAVCTAGSVVTDSKNDWTSGRFCSSRGCEIFKDCKTARQKESNSAYMSTIICEKGTVLAQDHSQLDRKLAIDIDGEMVDRSAVCTSQKTHIHKVTEIIEAREDCETTEGGKLEAEMEFKMDMDASETDIDASETDGLDDSVFDKVLAVLVRVRLNLEKLRDGQMLPYDPAPLLRLLNTAEAMMEETM